ncbi:MAG: gliding motility-associated C-terminal domain-containing protein [Crocinitomicaceae bacterium]
MKLVNGIFTLCLLFTSYLSISQCAINLGNDTTICPPDLIILDAGAGFSNYLWQDGSVNQTLVAFAPGTYWCQASDVNPTSNLIVNGDFESGNANFTTDYSVGTGGTWGPVSLIETYFITNNSNTAHSNFPVCSDNTSGTGNMMVINGSTTANQNIWCQTVTVTPNTSYILSAWFQIYGANPPDISYTINGTQVGANFTSTITGCTWQNHTVTWNSGTSNTADICFVNNELAGSGNDFSIDDIAFGPVCVATDTIVITGGGVQATVDNIVDASCENAADGSATVSGVTSTGAGPYTITWTDDMGNVHFTGPITPGGTNTQSNLTQGQWTVTISDGNGCDWEQIFMIGSGSVNFTTLPNDPQCALTPTGSIVVNTMGTGNFTFVITDTSGAQVNTTGSNAANNLFAGSYIVTYSDDNGCVISDNVTLIDPPLITPTISVTNPLCFGDTEGSVNVSNIINFQGSIDSINYIWTPNTTGVNGLNQTSLTGLVAGTYTLEVIDQAGCVNDVIFSIVNPQPLKGQITTVLPTMCRTASFQSGNGLVAAQSHPDSSGTGSTTYGWLHLGTGQNANTSTFVVRSPGLLELTITDANGCIYKDTVQVDSISPIADFEITSPQFYDPNIYEGTEEVKIKITNLSENFAQANNPNSDTIFQWNLYTNQEPSSNQNWFFTYDLDEKVDTVYNGEKVYEVCLIAKNYNDCKDTMCTDVRVFALTETILAPNVFTPGGFPNNTFFFPGLDEGIADFTCMVFNRYGVKVFEFVDAVDEWDGNHFKSGKPCADGVYFYTYSATATNGTEFVGEGQIHLMRAK